MMILIVLSILLLSSTVCIQSFSSTGFNGKIKSRFSLHMSDIVETALANGTQNIIIIIIIIIIA